MAKEHKHLTRKQKRKKRRRTLLIIELFLLVILLGALFVWMKFGQINFDDSEVQVATNELDEETEEILQGYSTFAIFGVDNRSVGNYDTGNSDSIMICSINNDTKEVKVMSVFRDTYLDVGGDSFQKCNAAYSHGGVQQAEEMLNKNLDLNIQNYVAVDFKALVDAVDAVGGVEIDVTAEEAPIFSDYLGEIEEVTGKHGDPVSPGLQTLNGAQALAYCRIRYTSGDDFHRAERQREVLTQLITKAKSASLLELNDLVDAIFPEVYTNLTASQILSLAGNMKDYELVETTGFPFDKTTTNLGSKGSVVVPCTLESNVRKMYEFLYDNPNYEPTYTVKELSESIQSSTGYDESSAVEYEW